MLANYTLSNLTTLNPWRKTRMNIVQKCIAWNAARYDQVLDVELAISLLTEETEELFSANTNIEVLDALGDITFVAIGVLWKANVPVEVIENILGIDDINTNALTSIDMRKLYIGYSVLSNAAIDLSNTAEEFVAINAALSAIFGIVLPRLISSGMEASFYDIVNAICDSNNTKVIKGKTDPSIKANIDKGENFVPPTKALGEILSKYTTLPSSIILN